MLTKLLIAKGEPERGRQHLAVFTSACVSMAVAALSSAGAASAEGASSVCMGSSVEPVAEVTPSVIEEIDCEQKKKTELDEFCFLPFHFRYKNIF